MSRILVVEDESAIAELMAINLRHAGFEVSIAGDADEATAQVDDALPDLVLLDWMLPGQSGLQLSRSLARPGAHARLADHHADRARRRDRQDCRPRCRRRRLPDQAVLAQGAAGAHPRACCAARRRRRSTTRSRWRACALDPATHRVTRIVDGVPSEAKVGPTEFRLLHFLMTHPERVHSRAQLLDRVWGDHVFIEERTVDVHIKRLREALDAGAVLRRWSRPCVARAIG